MGYFILRALQTLTAGLECVHSSQEYYNIRLCVPAWNCFDNSKYVNESKVSGAITRVKTKNCQARFAAWAQGGKYRLTPSSI